MSIGPGWSQFFITDAGLRMRTEVIAEKGQMNFTRAEVGEGKPTSPNVIGQMMALVDPKEDAYVVRSFVNTSADHSMVIKIDNADFPQEVLVTEVGVYAKLEGTGTEILYGYAYCLTGYAPMPPVSSQHRTWNVVFNTKISTTTDVTIVYDGSGVQFTYDEFEQAIKDYYTKAEVDAMFGDFVTQDDLDQALSDKATKTELADAVSDKVSQSDMDAALADKADTAELDAVKAELETVKDELDTKANTDLSNVDNEIFKAKSIEAGVSSTVNSFYYSGKALATIPLSHTIETGPTLGGGEAYNEWAEYDLPAELTGLNCPLAMDEYDGKLYVVATADKNTNIGIVNIYSSPADDLNWTLESSFEIESGISGSPKIATSGKCITDDGKIVIVEPNRGVINIYNITDKTTAKSTAIGYIYMRPDRTTAYLLGTKVYVYAGSAQSSEISLNTFIYDLTSNTWETVTGSAAISPVRYDASSKNVQVYDHNFTEYNGNLYLMGATTDSTSSVPKLGLWRFNTQAKSWGFVAEIHRNTAGAGYFECMLSSMENKLLIQMDRAARLGSRMAFVYDIDTGEMVQDDTLYCTAPLGSQYSAGRFRSFSSGLKNEIYLFNGILYNSAGSTTNMFNKGYRMYFEYSGNTQIFDKGIPLIEIKKDQKLSSDGPVLIDYGTSAEYHKELPEWYIAVADGIVLGVPQKMANGIIIDDDII